MQEELVRAWEYAYQLENLIVWGAERTELGDYDPGTLTDMLAANCQALHEPRHGGRSAKSASAQGLVDGILADEGSDVLRLPGGANEIVNFRRNPVDSPWVGELHQVLLSHGILKKMEAASSLLTSLPAHDGKAVRCEGLASAGLHVPLPTLPEGASYEPPRVVSEDAKFLTLDSRIHELEHTSIGTEELK